MFAARAGKLSLYSDRFYGRSALHPSLVLQACTSHPPPVIMYKTNPRPYTFNVPATRAPMFTRLAAGLRVLLLGAGHHGSSVCSPC